MYKQVGKQKALVTGLGILMKNSNNIKRGVSTADTLLLRALQTDRVTRHTHYAATVQPLSVMMMVALTGAQLLKSLSCKHSTDVGGKSRRKSKEPLCPGMSFPTDLPAGECHGSPGLSATPPPRSSDHFIRSCTPERCRLRYQRGRIPTVLLHKTEQ